MEHKPCVAIGLPVYNAERYLEQALAAILAQTYSDFELIVVDNASSDRTQEICLAYAAQDQRVRYYRNEKNLGAAPNFRRAFQLATSKYFKWAPYDDLIEPEFLARCVAVLDQHPEAVLCYTKAKIINEQGVYEADYDPGPDTRSSKPHERFRNLLLWPEYALQQMGLIRTEVLRATALHGSFPSSDEVLLAELALRGQFYELPERLYRYRRHSQQSTTHTELRTQRSRTVWFDTRFAGKITLPKWLYFFACLDAIRRAPVNFRERMWCYGHMARWLLKPPNFRAMGKDALLAGQQLVFRFLQKGKAKLQQIVHQRQIAV